MDKYKFLLKLLKNYKFKLMFFIFLSTLSIIISLFIPYVNKYIVDEVIIKGNFELLSSIVCVLFICYILFSIFEFTVNYLFWSIANKFLYELRIKILKKILDKKIEFFSKKKVGELVSRIQSETYDIVALLSSLKILYSQFINVLIILLLIFTINFRIAFIVCLGIPFILLVSIKTNPQLREKNKDLLIINSKITNVLQDNFNGINTIKVYRVKKYPLLRLSKESRSYIKKTFELFKIEMISSQILSFVNFVFPLMIITFGSILIKQAIITVGDIVVLITYVNRLYSNANSLINTIFSLQKSLTSLDRFKEIYMDEDINIIYKEKKIEIKELNSITLENVTFGFNDGNEIIKAFSHKFEKGKITFIMGSNGTGKSTLLNLIAGIYIPRYGNIYYNDKNLRDINESNLKKLIGYIIQDIWLFNDTIYNNVMLGRKCKDEVYLNKLLKILNFNLGLNEIIERNGSNISGGQKQKMAILRGFVNDPQVILIDEAFSNLDIQSREMLLKYLSDIKKDKIIVIVSHDKESLKFADEIICLDGEHISDIICDFNDKMEDRIHSYQK